jgi:hypothetical protein
MIAKGFFGMKGKNLIQMIPISHPICIFSQSAAPPSQMGIKSGGMSPKLQNKAKAHLGFDLNRGIPRKLYLTDGKG